MNEVALIRAIAAADQRALDQLYTAYGRRVFQYARSFVRNEADAEEVVVDTMLAVWNGAGRFDGRSRVATWILGIARHKALDAVRRRDGSHAPTEDGRIAEIADAGASPEDHADQHDTRRVMASALRQLSAEHREVLWLAFFEDLPYQEIAALLEVPVNTVKTRVYYAKQRLQSVLGPPHPLGRLP